MHILNGKLLEEIEAAKARIDRKKLDDYVREMFKCLSYETMVNASIQDSDNAKRKDEVMDNFQTAWDFGTRKFSEPVDFIYLTEVAGRVEPDLCELGQSYAPFRNGSARCFAGYLPPADEARVKEHLMRTLDTIDESDWHPIEKAVFLDFHITRIQPFQNGNKRTANIVMNSLLKANDFFPISVSPKHKSRYEGYMQGALQDFQRMGSTAQDVSQPYKFPGYGQRQFYDFLARIELSELKCAEDKMAHLSHYQIRFNDAQPNQLYMVKHKLQQWLRAHDLVHQVRLDLTNREIRVTGDIPVPYLEKAVSQTKKVGKYSITPLPMPENGNSSVPFGK